MICLECFLCDHRISYLLGLLRSQRRPSLLWLVLSGLYLMYSQHPPIASFDLFFSSQFIHFLWVWFGTWAELVTEFILLLPVCMVLGFHHKQNLPWHQPTCFLPVQEADLGPGHCNTLQSQLIGLLFTWKRNYEPRDFIYSFVYYCYFGFCWNCFVLASFPNHFLPIVNNSDLAGDIIVLRGLDRVLPSHSGS